MNVTLTPVEMEVARFIGQRWCDNAKEKNLRDKHGGERIEDPVENTASAVGAEMAFSKLMNVYYQPRFSKPHYGGDVNKIHEVRWTPDPKGDNRLIFHPVRDREDRLYWFVTGLPPVFFVHGCILGARGAVNGVWQDPEGKGRGWAYWVDRVWLTTFPADAWPVWKADYMKLEKERYSVATDQELRRIKAEHPERWGRPRTREHIPGR